jgi:hypothetical protein
MRANGQSIYPAGVADPALANPPGPPPELAVPMPPRTALLNPPAAAPPPSSPVWPPSNPASPSNIVPGTTGAGTWNTPAVVQPQVYPLPTSVPTSEKLTQASWYTRVDYFHWNERSGGTDFVNESGALYTLGYTRQIGIERFRAELFGGEMHYQGYNQVPVDASDPNTDYYLVPLSSRTDYLGLRGEYEMVLAPAAWEGRLALLAGLGSRFWIRGFPDGTDTQGNFSPSIQETWWTIYPYLGLETHLHLGSELELYSQSRIGATAVTYQYSSTDTNPLWPKPGIMANTEIGLRGPRFFVAARFEVMSWSPSPWVWGSQSETSQPNSVMFTAGGQLGFVF